MRSRSHMLAMLLPSSAAQAAAQCCLIRLAAPPPFPHRCPALSARPAPPPERYRHGDAQWCAPYAYKARQDLGCGGADKWRIVPGSAFPLEPWGEGSGSIYW